MTLQELEDYKVEAGPIPEPTCPAIDAVIKGLRSAYKDALSIAKAADLEEAQSLASDIEYELYGLDDQLEELRAQNDQLRGLGKFWYLICEDAASAPQDQDHEKGGEK